MKKVIIGILCVLMLLSTPIVIGSDGEIDYPKGDTYTVYLSGKTSGGGIPIQFILT